MPQNHSNSFLCDGMENMTIANHKHPSYLQMWSRMGEVRHIRLKDKGYVVTKPDMDFTALLCIHRYKRPFLISRNQCVICQGLEA